MKSLNVLHGWNTVFLHINSGYKCSDRCAKKYLRSVTYDVCLTPVHLLWSCAVYCKQPDPFPPVGLSWRDGVIKVSIPSGESPDRILVPSSWEPLTVTHGTLQKYSKNLAPTCPLYNGVIQNPKHSAQQKLWKYGTKYHCCKEYDSYCHAANTHAKTTCFSLQCLLFIFKSALKSGTFQFIITFFPFANI